MQLVIAERRTVMIHNFREQERSKNKEAMRGWMNALMNVGSKLI